MSGAEGWYAMVGFVDGCSLGEGWDLLGHLVGIRREICVIGWFHLWLAWCKFDGDVKVGADDGNAEMDGFTLEVNCLNFQACKDIQ